MRLERVGVYVMFVASCATVVGCRASDFLVVDPPLGIEANAPFNSAESADAAYAGAKTDMFMSLAGSNGIIKLGSLLSDEFVLSELMYAGPLLVGIDARSTAASQASDYEEGDVTLAALLAARSELLLAAAGMAKFKPTGQQTSVGEAYALVGYAETYLAETFCAGVPLSRLLPNGGLEFGMPLTTDSLLGVAEAHFDSAEVYAGSDITILSLIRVGRARARLNRGKYDEAAAAVSGVLTTFVYNLDMQPGNVSGAPFARNLYADELRAGCSQFNTTDREGGNGLNFISARDPRLSIDSTGVTCDVVYGAKQEGAWYLPTKFSEYTSPVSLATGVEARLIEAEAALHAGQIGTWAAKLNTLRDSAPATYLALASAVPMLTSDSTTTATSMMREDVMFRERAFWLYGTGTRLGDMRRLIRQYGRPNETVFPTGSYENGNSPYIPLAHPSYGTDVSLTLPTAASRSTTKNPHYQGCLSSVSTA